MQKWVLVVLVVAVGACKQSESQRGSEAKGEKHMQVTGKSAEVAGKIQLPEQTPIAPGTALVILEVVKVLPGVEPAGSGPCSQVACRAEVRVRQVVGVGSAFLETVSQGQVLQVFFPMTLTTTGGWPGAPEGAVVKAELQAPALNSSLFSVQHYTLVP